MLFNKHDRAIAARVGVMEVIAFDTMEKIVNVMEYSKDPIKTAKFKKINWQFKMMFTQLENMMSFFEENMTEAQYKTLVNTSKMTTDLIEGKKI